jgi:hypothetical protein
MEDFVCPYCHQLKDWASQMVIVGSSPETAHGIICGMPYKELGFCHDCLEGVNE